MTARKRLRAALRRPYVITDTTLRADRTHLSIARAAIAGGAGIVQLRDKQLTPDVLARIGAVLMSLAHGDGALLIVNDSLEAALGAQADGLHVGLGDLPVRHAREALGPDAIIGASVDTIEQARAAEQDGADYLGVGPVFATSTKPDAGEAIGLQPLRVIRAAVGIPIVAIGGLTLENVGMALAAGADGAAFISAVVCAEDMKTATRDIATAMARFGREP